MKTMMKVIGQQNQHWLQYMLQCFVISVLSSSLIDRRGFLPPNEAVPAASASEIELPPFVAKNDAHMVGWTSLWSLPSPDCPIVHVLLLVCPLPVCLLHSVSNVSSSDVQLQSIKQSCRHAELWICAQCYESCTFFLHNDHEIRTKWIVNNEWPIK